VIYAVIFLHFLSNLHFHFGKQLNEVLYLTNL
jgi:hypothetical protein